MKELIVAWQDPESRTWLPVGRLVHKGDFYLFVYTKGAASSRNFQPFGAMINLNAVYVSKEIFPLFANRILAKSRPEYSDYIRWLGLSNKQFTELEVLARSGGVRATDTLEIFPCPSADVDGNYTGYFFSHGFRYLIQENQDRINQLLRGEELYLVMDIQNRFDPKALLMRTHDPLSLVGYCPRYLSGEFCELISLVGPENVKVSVEKVNPDAPTEMRLLCKIVAPWPENYFPCSKGLYEPLADTSLMPPSYALL